ncbi:MAG: glutaredoxin family protein [Chloroflexia bacterium]
MEENRPAESTAERGVNYPLVTIYTSNDCRWCGVAKQYLAERGVPYTEKNVELDEAAGMEAIQLAGKRGTPVIVVGTSVIVGFQRDQLDAALGPGVPSTDPLAANSD